MVLCHNNHFRVNKLTWQDGIIPPEEIWVKIGGDKGGKSFKMSFQICNVPQPNSVQNTCVFAVFEAKDTPTNLHLGLDHFRSEINSLQLTVWRYKCIVKMIISKLPLNNLQNMPRERRLRLFFFGDYELVCPCTVLQVPQVMTVKFIL